MAFSYSPKIVTDGLVLYLDAANIRSYVSGSTIWNDISRGGNNGTLVNGPTFNSANGGSIVFDGTNDYSVIPSTSNLAPGTGDFTYSAWINPSSFLGTYSSTLVVAINGGLWIGKNGSNFVLRAYNVADYIQYGVLPTLNVWTNITITRSGTSATLYYNSIPVAVGTTSQNFVQGTTYIGNDGAISSANFNGKISNTSFYKGKSLSTAEVLQNYNTTKTRFGL